MKNMARMLLLLEALFLCSFWSTTTTTAWIVQRPIPTTQTKSTRRTVSLSPSSPLKHILFVTGEEEEEEQQRHYSTSALSMTDNGGEEEPLDDDECADEEECEIDWSKMPDDDSDEVDEEVAGEVKNVEQPPPAATTATAAFFEEFHSEDLSIINQEVNSVDDDDLDALDDFPDDVDDDVDDDADDDEASKARLRLEMSWSLREAEENCDVDRPQTCGSEPCMDCRGRGQALCRFCHGTAILSFTKQESEFVYRNTVMDCTICNKRGTEQCQTCQGTGWVAEWTQLEEEDGPMFNLSSEL